MIKSGNPALSKKTFDNLKSKTGEVMTLDGAVNKIAISLAVLLFAAYYTYTNAVMNYVWVGSIGGFIVALVTIYKKEWAPVTVPIYAVLEGLALGGISKLYAEMFEPGIVPQAISLTLGILIALLFAYKTKIIKVTENFKLGVFAATMGLLIVYLISYFMSVFGVTGLPIMNPANASVLSIGFFIFVIFIALILIRPYVWREWVAGLLGVSIPLIWYLALKFIYNKS